MSALRWLRTAAVVSAASAVAAIAAGSTPADVAPTRTLPGSVPAWAQPANRVGSAAGSDRVAFRVYLSWRGGNAAAALATAVSTPGSASYGKFLTPAQFRTRFAPSRTDVAAVQQWLRGAGFSVDYTPANNRYVQAEGTVAQAATAFHTTFSRYRVSGKTLRAPNSALSVPSSVPASVSSVVGLDQTSALVKPAAPPSAAFVNAPPCSTYWAEKTTATDTRPDGVVVPGAYGHPLPWAPCGYTPSQVRSAYGVAGSGLTGAGQTVAIIDAYASPTILSDVNTYSSLHGLPQMTNATLRQIVPPGVYSRPQNPAQDPQGWYGEETLDVEAVHGVAPAANIVYVGSPNNYQDLDAAMNYVVDNHVASIVTNSYGFSTELLPPGFVQPFENTLIEAAATGIGVYFSSGDSGDETGGTANPAIATPDWPAVSPWVTAVGGTSLAVGAAGEYLFETGWETGTSSLTSAGTWSPAPPGSYLYGSGGGTSRIFTQPAYQAGVVPSAIATANGDRPQPMRVVPDVSAFGDPQTGYLIGQTQTFPDGTTKYSEYRIGGTSLSSPIYAGLIALAQQNAGRTFGFANPLLYSTSGSSANHDVLPPASPLAVVRDNYVNSVDATDGYATRLRSLNFDSVLTIRVRPGYDDVTGIGSPNGAAWLAALS
jgi:subtilase family serine protease